METLLAKAINIALQAQKDEVDLQGMPYAGHIMRVMGAGKTVDEKIVGALHDLVEDTDFTLEYLLAQGFPQYIVDAVGCLTKQSDDEPYDSYIERVKGNPLAVAVKINDLTDNMDIRRYHTLTDVDVDRMRKYLKVYHELVNMRK